MRWAAALHRATGGKVVAIDGKTLRRSFDRAKGLSPLHRVLDFTFREDESRTRKGHGAQNIAALRRLAITLLKREPSKQSLATKRLIAGWDDDYLLRILLAAGEG